MEIAKVTSKGQITIPVDIRKRLGLKAGDKVLFLEGDNQCVIINATLAALKEAQEGFKGAAEEAGLENEQDLIDIINEMRRGDIA